MGTVAEDFAAARQTAKSAVEAVDQTRPAVLNAANEPLAHVDNSGRLVLDVSSCTAAEALTLAKWINQTFKIKEV